MAGPPSQAGKFKPRKPAKKIKIGATTPAAARAPAPAPSQRSSGRGGRGRGRGGGRGRGRGRAPMPQGAVFFTGNAPPVVASKRKSRASASSSSAKTTSTASKGGKTKASTERMDSTEEIVGELEVGIGGATLMDTTEQTKKKASRKVKIEEDEEETSTRKASKFEPSVDMYDSDSSDEGLVASTHQENTTVPPTELPFPVAPLPVGVGSSSTERAVMYACQKPEEAQGEKNEPVHVGLQEDAPLVSPFVDWRDGQRREEEKDSWFLCQFPTRLPELKSTNTAIPDSIKSEGVSSSSLTPDTVQSTPSNVVTPATVTSGFDNALVRASPGRLGKIVVYKSGKTELVMGGDNGGPEIRMNVTEGLPCGFVQQAVAIDTEESTYVPLGEVKKTVVVTPNVEDAFSSY